MLFGAMNSPLRPILEEIEVISGLGFDYLELSMDPPEAHHSIVREQREEILRALDVREMQIVCHLPTFVTTADLTPALRETSVKEVLQAMGVAAGLKPLKLVLHPSYFSGLGVRVMRRARKLAMESLEAIVEEADRLNQCLCIENMFPRLRSLTDPEDFVEIFERFPKLNMTLDIGHANIGSKGPDKTLRFIKMFSDRILHIHASDNSGRGDDHIPVGAGTVDFEQVIGALEGIGYGDTVTFEIFSRDRDYLRISREKFAAMLRHT
jgi:sugar phosphate isomerase/epimerase